MTQQVKIAGTIYENVPLIRVPDEQNIYHEFIDTSDANAATADIANGKTAYVNGSKIIGTNVPLQTDSLYISRNGDYTAPVGHAYSQVTAAVTEPAGASNIVIGEFISGLADTVTTVNIEYEGDGYPISLLLYVKGGLLNSTSAGDSVWYSTIQANAIGLLIAVKAVANTLPSYTGGSNDKYSSSVFYKSSSTDASIISCVGSKSETLTNNVAAASGRFDSVRFTNASTLSVYSASTLYGLMPGVVYQYIINYSE